MTQFRENLLPRLLNPWRNAPPVIRGPSPGMNDSNPGDREGSGSVVEDAERTRDARLAWLRDVAPFQAVNRTRCA